MQDPKMSPQGQELLERLMGQGAPQTQAAPGFQAQQPSPLEMIGEQMQQMGMFLNMLREGMQQMSYGQSSMGIMLDTCRLYIQMVSRIIIEAGIISEEDFESKYKVEVTERLKALMEEAEAQAEAEMKAEMETAGATCEPCEAEDCTDCTDCPGFEPVEEVVPEPDLDVLRERQQAGEMLLASERELLAKEEAAQQEEELEGEDE